MSQCANAAIAEKSNMQRLLIALLIIVLSGCGRMEVRRKVEGFDNSITYYTAALRWGYYQQALAYHITRDNEKLAVDIDPLEEIRIIGVDIKDKLIEPNQTQAGVIGEISYYLKSYGVIKKLKFEQVWWYNAESERWFTESEFPQFELK